VMSEFSKQILPLSALSVPEIMLKRVVFPLPLGPMSPVMVFLFTSRETPSTATRPPKLLATFSSARMTDDGILDHLPF
jgi:hypothetical protein